MFKRIISLGLCLVMLTVLFAGCGKQTTTTTTSTDDLPATINLIGITEQSTTQDAIDAVETALNKISQTRYKTKINLTLVKADDYIKEIETRVAEADQAAIKLKAINKYNALAQKEANNAQKLANESGKKNNKWTSQVTTVLASTLSTGKLYTAEETKVNADGTIETVYPDAQSPIDIVMIDSRETYDYLNEKGYLLSVEKKLDEKFTKFRQYIYPTFFSQLKAMTGEVNAIPNNNLLAEYTYLIVDKAIAEEYSFNIDNVDNYGDLKNLLANVKKDHADMAPLAVEPDALGIYTYMDGEVAIGAYCDPIYGYDPAEDADFKVQNLLAIPQYQEHVKLMEEYRKAGYIDTTKTKFAVNVIKGDASVAAEYADDYEVKVIQNPFVEADAIFNGMMAVSSYTSSEDRALEIIEMFTTDPDAKNLLQYGIQDDGDNTQSANYKLIEVERGQFTIQRLNNTYMMNNGLTGNVYMGYPEEGQVFNAWDYYKQTNLDSAVSPFLLLYVEETELNNILASVLKRAALTDALKPLDIDYDEYVKGLEGTKASEYIEKVRTAYMEFFISELAKTDAASKPLNFVAKSGASAAVTEFIKFAQSKEGQAILNKAGYAGDTSAASYQKVSALTGEITLIANTGSVKTYIEPAFNGLADAFSAMYPNVKITRPEVGSNGYDTSMSTINNTNTIGMTYAAIVDGLEITTVAKNYEEIFANKNHAVYSQTWYENKLVDKVKNENYSQLISARDLENLIKDKISELAGAPLVDSTRKKTLATSRGDAASYFTNIKYLRVMADEVLFGDLSKEERAAKRAQYDAMTDIAFEKAIFEYVKQNYIDENNLTDDEYEKRVKNFMVSVLEFTSEEDNTVKYLVSWDEFDAAGEGSKAYETAANNLKATYLEKLKAKFGNGVQSWSLTRVMDGVYDVMYEESIADSGMSKAEFDEMIQDKYLRAVGTNAVDFNNYKATSDEYKNYVKKLRKKYKAILIDNFSSTAYKNGEKGISNEKVVSTLYNHFLEEEIGIYKQMADAAGLSLNEFKTAEKHYQNYERYISTLKTKYTYTLQAAKYTTTQINGWSLEEARENIFNVLMTEGFYTNELARYIGLDLNGYMREKSMATAYQGYLETLANALSAEIAAKGEDKTKLLEGDGAKLEALANEIVLEKYFNSYESLADYIKDFSGKFVKDYDNLADMQANAKKLSDNAFFMAVVNELQAMWTETKEALNG